MTTGQWKKGKASAPDLIAMDKAPERMAHDRIPFLDTDPSETARHFDVDGRMHVKISNISKSNVCPYYGREIPNSEQMGLEPDKMYRLWRAPDELLKSLPTWNNLPLLDGHVATSADKPQKDRVVGSTGTDAGFSDPYLTNSLVIWDGGAIALVEANKQRELSCGYRYVADMTPGTIDGEEYDGVMRSIVGNHVALVEEGRAGSDVLVGDSKPEMKGRPTMSIKTSHNLRSRTAIMAQGALVAFLAPRMAADAQIDLTPVLKGINATNFKHAQGNILKALVLATDGKLAADADLDEAAELLEQIDRTKSAKDDEIDDNVDTSTAKDGEEEDPDAKKAEDEELDEDGNPVKKAEDAEEGEMKEEMVDKKAMDSAIAKAKRDTRTEVMAELQAMDAARTAVKPHIGTVGANVSSATEIYKMALDSAIASGADIDLDGVPASAYPALVKMLPVPGARPAGAERLAVDAASAKGFSERFPAAATVRHV